jgi:hypothetical protein
MDTAGLNWNDRHFRANAAVFTSTAQNIRSSAFSLSGGRKIRNWGEIDVNWLQSRAAANKTSTKSLITTFREYLSPRLELAQFVTRNDGNTTVSFGGNLIGNRLSAGLEYQTVYVPYLPTKPFTQAAVINIRFRPFGNVELNGGTAVGADGRVRYTAWGNSLMVHNERYGQPAAAMTIPKYIIRGHVADEAGNRSVARPCVSARSWLSPIRTAYFSFVCPNALECHSRWPSMNSWRPETGRRWQFLRE